MTTPEHTLVGLHVAIALGTYHRYGWSLVALSAVASNIPDWDGLPILIDMQRFESGHRVWGHNLGAIVISSLIVAWTQHQFHWIEYIGSRAARYFPKAKSSEVQPEVDSSSAPIGLASVVDQAQSTDPQLNANNSSWLVLLTATLLAQLIHLPCDMVVSGGQGLSDWMIQPFWPLSKSGYVFPLIPWGDIGPTVILMAGCIVLAKMPQRSMQISWATLLLLVSYLVVRGCWLH